MLIFTPVECQLVISKTSMWKKVYFIFISNRGKTVFPDNSCENLWMGPQIAKDKKHSGTKSEQEKFGGKSIYEIGNQST